jgi:ribosomal protein L37E
MKILITSGIFADKILKTSRMHIAAPQKIKNAHSQEQNKKERNNKDCVAVMKYLQQQLSEHHERQHSDCKRGSLKATHLRRKQCTSVVVAQSKKIQSPGIRPNSQNNVFSKAIARYNP